MTIIKYNKQRSAQPARDTQQTIQTIQTQAAAPSVQLADLFSVTTDSQGNTRIIAQYELASVGEITPNYEDETDQPEQPA